MPRIKMIRSEIGSDDGLTTKCFEAGQIYDVGDDLADVFVEIGVAELDAPEAAPAPAEEPKAAEVLSNKSMFDRLSNKGKS